MVGARAPWPTLAAWNSAALFADGARGARRRRLLCWIVQRCDITAVVETHGQDNDLDLLPRLPQHHVFHSAHDSEARTTGGILMCVAKSTRWSCRFEVIFPGRVLGGSHLLLPLSRDHWWSDWRLMLITIGRLDWPPAASDHWPIGLRWSKATVSGGISRWVAKLESRPARISARIVAEDASSEHWAKRWVRTKSIMEAVSAELLEELQWCAPRSEVEQLCCTNA